MDSEIAVGSAECPINTLALIVRPSTKISNEWSTFAMELNIGSEHIEKFRKDLLLDKITNLDVIRQVLELWVAENGSTATLGKLLNVVEGPCGANDAGESLRLHFRLPCIAAEGNPSIDWNDIPHPFQNRITETFQNFFPTLKFSETLPNLKGPFLIMLMTGEKPQVFVHPFSETLPYYVTRTLITRNIISKQIFKQNYQDIFLFTGMDPSELSDLAGKKLTGSSTAQLRYSSDVKFMILDRTHHFDKICERNKNPVHLLRREADGRLRWIRSSGGIGNLQEYVDELVTQDEFEDEEVFCRHLDSQAMTVLICDSPGMGKSVLLAQIGATLSQLYPERTVLFIALTEFIKGVKSLGMNDEIKMIEIALQEYTGVPVKMNLEEIASVSIELLLDGFDEVDSVDYKLELSILQNISTSFKSIRLWVTSRPHLMEELETSLNVLGYNMRPFNEQDQVQFPSSFWSRKEQLDKSRSRLFAENCLKSLKSKMGSHSQDIAGIPLQCLLIGEVYEDDAVEYAGLGNDDGPPIGIEIGTITELYRRLIRKKIDKYESLNGKLGENELMAIHARLGVKLIFRDEMEAFNLEPIPTIPSDITEFLKVGIIVKSSGAGSCAFMHRTFAEYFVAWFMGNKLGREGEWTGEMNRLFLHCVLECRDTKFLQPVICYFLNSSIGDLAAGNNSSQLCTQLDTESPWIMMTDIARACATADLVHIFKLFHGRYESDESYTSIIFTDDFLLHSITYSSLELVTLIVTQLEKQDRFSIEVQGEALHKAVRFGKFSIVEFLIKEKEACGIVEDLSYGAGELVRDCIEGSVSRSAEEVENRIQVLRMLIRINGSLLNNKVRGCPPLLFDFVHVKLLIELVRLGADALAEHQGYTVLHVNGRRILFSSEYHSLVMSIPDASLRILVHRKDRWGDTPLTSALEWIDPAPETLDVFHCAGANFNHTDSLGSSLFEMTIRYGRSAVTIRKIIQHGEIKVLGQAKTFSIMRLFRRNNPLHFAAEWGNVEAVGVFVDEYRIDVNSKDERGRTPLDRLIESDKDRFATGWALKERGGRFKDDKALIVAVTERNVQSVHLLISFGVDVNGTDIWGNTPLHKSVQLKHGIKYFDSIQFAIVQLLVHSGADLTVLNKLGNTPLQTALKNEDLDIQTCLMLKSKTDLTIVE